MNQWFLKKRSFLRQELPFGGSFSIGSEGIEMHEAGA